MKYSQLAAFITLLLGSFGEVEQGTCFQEDCAGKGMISAAMLLFGLPAHRRDVSWKHACGFEARLAPRYCTAVASTSSALWAS